MTSLYYGTTVLFGDRRLSRGAKRGWEGWGREENQILTKIWGQNFGPKKLPQPILTPNLGSKLVGAIFWDQNFDPKFWSKFGFPPDPIPPNPVWPLLIVFCHQTIL